MYLFHKLRKLLGQNCKKFNSKKSLCNWKIKRGMTFTFLNFWRDGTCSRTYLRVRDGGAGSVWWRTRGRRTTGDGRSDALSNPPTPRLRRGYPRRTRYTTQHHSAATDVLRTSRSSRGVLGVTPNNASVSPPSL